MSVLDTPPEDRQPVLTYVGPYDEGLALGAVRRELLRGGQVFWVHNRVRRSTGRPRWLQQEVPEARVIVAHGQMDEDRLEKEMLQFWEREADVLVCTTIIESGLDVPTANTLVVERADRLGLAQMYQLRGRVGRSRRAGVRLLLLPAAAQLTEEAHERLASISRFTALGCGFQIAMRDLEIRGAGNLLGAEQHGHIAAVGFDTYCGSWQEAVAEMKGEPVAEEQEVRIDLPVRAFIPPGWVGQEALRLELYRRMSTARDHAALDDIRAETDDRFGVLPPEVETLFAIASLRVTAPRSASRRSGRSASRSASGRSRSPTRSARSRRADPRRDLSHGEVDAEPRSREGIRRGARAVGRGTVARSRRARACRARLALLSEPGDGPVPYTQ